MKKILLCRLMTSVIATIMLVGASDAATCSYNLVQLANTTVSSDDGQSDEGDTSPSVLLSGRSQWQPNYNITLGEVNPYEVTYDFQAIYEIEEVTLKTMFRYSNSQSLSQFFIETSINGTDWVEFGQWNGSATSDFSYTFTPETTISARYLRYRVPAGQYTAVSGDHYYGGPGLHWMEIMTPADTEFSSQSTLHSIAFSELGGSVTVTDPPIFNRGGNLAVVNDGLWSTGYMGHNDAENGWGADAKLVVDVGDKAFDISGMELLWGKDRGHYFPATGYTLESSTDGVNWSSVSFTIDSSARGKCAHKLIFEEPFLAEYLRVGNLTEPTNAADPTIGLMEILVYGTEPLPGGTVFIVN